MDNIFELAKSMVDLRTIVDIDDMKSHGEYYSGRCPFHDDQHSSFLVYKDGWVCLAASCKKQRGSILDWMAYKEGNLNPSGKDLYEIARKITGDVKRMELGGSPKYLPPKRKVPPKKEGMPKVILDQSVAHRYHKLLNVEALAYFESRGFTEEFVRANYWGWTGASIVLPVWDGLPGKSLLVGLRFRNIHDPEIGYYGVSEHNYPVLFGRWVVHYACEHTEEVPQIYVFFGELDSALALQFGIPAVSPTAGCRSFDPSWVVGYEGDIIFVPDRTKGEEQFAMRSASRIGLRGLVKVLPESYEGKDFNEQALSALRDGKMSGYLSNFHRTIKGRIRRLLDEDRGL